MLTNGALLSVISRREEYENRTAPLRATSPTVRKQRRNPRGRLLLLGEHVVQPLGHATELVTQASPAGHQVIDLRSNETGQLLNVRGAMPEWSP
jgi:hypothetical protein